MLDNQTNDASMKYTITIPYDMATNWTSAWVADVVRREIDREILRELCRSELQSDVIEKEEDGDFLPVEIKNWLTATNATYELIGYELQFDDPNVAAQFAITWL
jgi:hypothetical protein